MVTVRLPLFDVIWPKVEEVMLVLGRAQVRVIQDVVQLGAELQPHPLADGLPPAHDGIEADGSGVAKVRFRARAAAERIRRGTGDTRWCRTS